MYPECKPEDGLNRRDFLSTSAGAFAALAAAAVPASTAIAQAPAAPVAAEPMPSIKLGEHTISRLIAGYNPIGGHSHTTLDMAKAMTEYFTAEQTAEFLLRCESQGVNTWQYDHTDKVLEAIRIARDKGSEMQLICLHSGSGSAAPLDEVMKYKPIAIVHHGGVTDGLFRAGKSEEVHDFVKKVHDAGALAGVSSHCPDHIKQVADEGWENDLFMTCFYYVNRPAKEMEEQLGKVPVGEAFFQSDPDDMTAVVRQVSQPCLGFKILAAGRVCWNKTSIENAHKYAFENIKPTDAVIVGMFPRYSDQVAENAGYARKHGVV